MTNRSLMRNNAVVVQGPLAGSDGSERSISLALPLDASSRRSAAIRLGRLARRPHDQQQQAAHQLESEERQERAPRHAEAHERHAPTQGLGEH